LLSATVKNLTKSYKMNVNKALEMMGKLTEGGRNHEV